MKNIIQVSVLLFATTLSSNTLSQEISTFGISVGGATTGAIVVDMLIGTEANRFHLGVSYQFGGQKGEEITDRKSNYGLTVDGNGDYFLTVDLGYSRIVNEKFTIQPDISIGSRYHYTNYVDQRFTADGYHMIDKKVSIFGVGLNAGFIFHENFEVFAGYNTIRSVTFGMRLLLNSI